MPITGTYVTDAVLRQLQTAFPEIPYRYLERQTQNIQRPCFCIQQVQADSQRILGVQNKSIHTPQTGEKYRKQYKIYINWIPLLESRRPQRECAEMGQRLTEQFRTLELPGLPAFCREVSYTTENGELQFSFTVTIYAQWAEDPGPEMLAMDLAESINIQNERSN